jgi:hypothetical protein
MEIKNTEPKKEVIDSQGARNAPKQEHADTLNPRWASLRKIGLRTVQVVLVVFGFLVIIRIPVVLEREETAKVVAKIHATKLTMDDVMGKNLPPDPGADADKTIAGVDANKNGIRDDVELAIFRDHASSSRERSVFLQFALAQQTMMTLPIVNPQTVTAVIEDLDSRANVCLWSLHAELRVPYDAHFNDPHSGELGKKENEMWNQYLQLTNADEKYIKNLQFDSEERYSAYKSILNGNLRSYESSNEGCDVDSSMLPS